MDRDEYIQSMDDTIDIFLRKIDELAEKPEIKAALDAVGNTVRKGRSFRDIALDDALTIVETTLYGTGMQEPPYHMYLRLFTERWGGGRKVERHGIERLDYLIHDDPEEIRALPEGFPQMHLILEAAAASPDIVAEAMNTGLNPLMREMERITLDDMQLRSVEQHDMLKREVAKAAKTLNQKMIAVKSQNVTVITKQAEPEQVIGIVHQPDEIGNWRDVIDRMVGMKDVRDEISRREIDANALSAEKYFGFDSDAEKPYMNMVMVGPPGVGKTTVARMMGAIYKDAGLLSKGHVVEVGRADLCAQYIGQTAPKTKAAFESAKGGILFIDEAYSLYSEGRDYGKEAIEELVRLTSIHRDTIVIVAGYPEDMKALMEMNAGLARRFPKSNYVSFSDMKPAELMEVANRTLFSMKAHFSDAAKDSFGKLVEEVKEREGKQFGNAGTVNELVAAVKSEHNRICDTNGVMDRVTELAKQRTLTQQMIPMPEDLVKAWRTVDVEAVEAARGRVLRDFFAQEKHKKQPIGFNFPAPKREPANGNGQGIAVPEAAHL